MAAVPVGGPSTVNGVLYQLLWSLATLGGFRATAQHIVEDRLDQITLILEPSMGGDQQTFSAGKRIVTQLKARSTAGTWSLQEIIRDILPDLLLAVDLTKPDDEYHFVTEGRRGKWAMVEDFFRKLPPPLADGDLFSQLSDAGELAFSRSRSPTKVDNPQFWEPGPYSCRKLFEKIVATIRGRQPFSDEDFETTCRKVWQLLRGFRFVGGQSHQTLRHVVGKWLLARIGSADRLPQVRDHLLLDLARLACVGDAKVDSAQFFQIHGLDGIPLTDSFQLNARAQQYLAGTLRRKGAELSDDSRPDLTSELLSSWTSDKPILVLTGESGSGKSWHGFGVLVGAMEEGDISILVDARGDADQDKEDAAKTFWHHIAGRDEAPPLSRISRRINEANSADVWRQFTLLIDNVVDLDEARRLVESAWEEWGIRVAITCPKSIAGALRSQLGERGRVVNIPDFTSEELRSFMSDVLEMKWEDVPYDVANTLRRPLLARLFREVVPIQGWKPRSEYEIYERSWDRLRERKVTQFDLESLRFMAHAVLLGSLKYPWTVSDLKTAALDDDALQRLIKAGWLLETADDAYEIWHDRLLNWSVAEAVAHALRHDKLSRDELSEVVAKLLLQPNAPCGRMLGYVPLDVLWLLADPIKPDERSFRQIVESIENSLGWRAPELFSRGSIPSLGERATPFLLERLRAAAESGRPELVTKIIEGLVASGDAHLAEHGLTLVMENNPRIQRAGVLLLARTPNPKALDRLWAIHKTAISDPHPFLWEQEDSLFLYRDTYTALSSGITIDHVWLELAINNADTTIEPVHDLAYLVSSLGEQIIWERCKRTLMEKVSDEKQRSLATCIFTFQDASEKLWLEKRIGIREDILGMAAFRALTKIYPERALDLLESFEDGQLYLFRNWYFAELHRRLPADVMERFVAILRQRENPWQFAQLLQGKEDLIDVNSFDFLLDCFDENLNSAAGLGYPKSALVDLRRAIAFINAVSRPALLDRLRQRRETSLDRALANWLLSAGPQSGGYRQPDKADSLDALAKMGGDAFSLVLDDWLTRGDWGARLVAIDNAHRRITPSTVALLTRMTYIDEPADEKQRAALWGYAAGALAAHRCWGPVLAYYRRMGIKSLSEVQRYALRDNLSINDDALNDVLLDLRKYGGPSPGSILAVSFSGRADLLPEVRSALRLADPGSDLSTACLITLFQLGDNDPAIVEVVKKSLFIKNSFARNALLRNGSPPAELALREELQRTSDPDLALILMNRPHHRSEALNVLRNAIDSPEFQVGIGGVSLEDVVFRLNQEALREAANCQELFAFAEEVGLSPETSFRIVGHKPAALRIVGQRQPETAWRIALARLGNHKAPDGELYVSIVVDFYPNDIASALLDVLLLEPAGFVIESIGRQLGRLNAAEAVRTWITSADAKRRLAACRVASFFIPSSEFRDEVGSCSNDENRDVAAAAVNALEKIRLASITEELVAAIVVENDLVHRWTLLDAILSIGDPGDIGVGPSWLPAILPSLTPAMTKQINERLKKRREKRKDELEQQDKRRERWTELNN